MSGTTSTASTPKCGECGSPMILRVTKKFTYSDGTPRRFWGCSRWPDCDGIHGAHPDGSPCGIPADKATKKSRIAAHALLDTLWKRELGGSMTRGKAYWLMRTLMDIDKDDAHVAMFDTEQCDRLIARLTEFLATRGGTPSSR
jgi:ssDNA-binding Zn-finger/Zn-ribbon topoisomerase 1